MPATNQQPADKGLSKIPLSIGAFGAAFAIIGLFTPYGQNSDFSWASGLSEDYISSAPFVTSIIFLLLALGLVIAPIFVKRSPKVTGLTSGLVQLFAACWVLGNLIVNSEVPDGYGFFEVYGVGWWLIGIGSLVLLVAGVLTVIFALRTGGTTAPGSPGQASPSGALPYGAPPAYQPAPRAGQPQPGQPQPQPGQPRPAQPGQPGQAGQPGDQPFPGARPQPGQPQPGQSQPGVRPGQPQPGAQPGQPPYGYGQPQQTPQQQYGSQPQQYGPQQPGQSPYGRPQQPGQQPQ